MDITTKTKYSQKKKGFLFFGTTLIIGSFFFLFQDVRFIEKPFEEDLQNISKTKFTPETSKTIQKIRENYRLSLESLYNETLSMMNQSSGIEKEMLQTLYQKNYFDSGRSFIIFQDEIEKKQYPIQIQTIESLRNIDKIQKDKIVARQAYYIIELSNALNIPVEKIAVVLHKRGELEK